MHVRLFDFPHRYRELDDFRAQMARLFSETEPGIDRRHRKSSWPRVTANDVGESYVVEAEVPGLGTEDLDVSLTADTLTLSGERKIEAPEGASIHRQERPSLTFSRSFTFEIPVQVDHVSANVKNGLLTVVLPKVAEKRPRTIAITAG